ncbi:hypothetical protein RND71_005667 [Anisodus tanguticus]|uniref:Uncharacterized protein n=1 Tax=Anisodus tanguticus TaxID=243964 RepID=A0AAE1SSG9_9SOLA|nr:hypothetical protein RND71_005667 [Anisodus tanguticus]
MAKSHTSLLIRPVYAWFFLGKGLNDLCILSPSHCHYAKAKPSPFSPLIVIISPKITETRFLSLED